MKKASQFIAGMVVATVLLVSLGAYQGTDPYTKACIGLQAELEFIRALDGKQLPRFEEAKKRVDYWMHQMEKFRPYK